MKKTALFAGLVLASVLGSQAADIYSANVVGYTKVDLVPGYNLVATQFVPVNTDGPLDINELVADATFSGFENGGFTTKMQVWGGSGYIPYYWTGTDSNLGEFSKKWVNGDWTTPVLDFPAGTGYFIQTPTDGAASAVTFAGQVSTNNTETISLVAGYNMIANPFPQAISIQDIQSDDLPGFENGGFTTKMQVWGGSGYIPYYWTGTDTNLGEFAKKWVNGDWSTPNVNFQAGVGFFIDTPSPATVNFMK